MKNTSSNNSLIVIKLEWFRLKGDDGSDVREEETLVVVILEV